MAVILQHFSLHPVQNVQTHIHKVFEKVKDVAAGPVDEQRRRRGIEQHEKQGGHAVYLNFVTHSQTRYVNRRGKQVDCGHDNGQHINMKTTYNKQAVRCGNVRNAQKGLALKRRIMIEQMVGCKEERYLDQKAKTCAHGHDGTVVVLPIQRPDHGVTFLHLEHGLYFRKLSGHLVLNGAFTFLPCLSQMIQGQKNDVHCETQQDQGQTRRMGHGPGVFQHDLHAAFQRPDEKIIKNIEHS